MGLEGTAIATTATQVLCLIIFYIYLSQLKDLKESVFLPNKDSFNLKGLLEFLKLAIPSAVMCCLEWWSFEIMTLMSAFLGV